MSQVRLITALSSVTANTTSGLIYIGDYNRVALRFHRTDNGGGTSTFKVEAGYGQIASDSPSTIPYNMLIDNVTNSNAQTLTRVASKAIANNTGNVMVWLTPEAMPTHIKVIVDETTDGTHSADVIGYSD